MQPYEPPVRDILFILRHVIDTERVLALPRYAHADWDTLRAVVEAAGRVTAEVIAPINEACDRIGADYANGNVTLSPGFVDAYRTFCDGGWAALDLPLDFDGQQMPALAQGALSDMSNGASLAFSMLTTVGRSAAHVLLAHADEGTRQIYIPRLASGIWSGTIAMTEPHAGSDIGLARTKATRCSDGTYAIDGAKIFISYGDHDAVEQICHIVLARTDGAPDGVRGLSLFLVPKFLVNTDGRLGARNGVRVARIEDKMGIHGSPTCELQFEQATGFLLGEECRGIQNMFTMINTMRLEVAFEGVGVAGAAFGNAARYAAERPQGSAGDRTLPIIEHPDVRRMLMTMKALTSGARALAFEAAYQIDLSRAAETDDERREATEMAAFLLPICKATFADMAVEVANLGIQVHGGHGYIKEQGAEQLMRDARITPIYEGTNGIQAIDLVTRKLGRDQGRTFALLAERIDSDLSRCADDAAIADIHGMVGRGLGLWQDLSDRMVEWTNGALPDALAGATPYLRLAGRIVMGWMWLRMAAVRDDAGLGDEKRSLARFYARYIMSDLQALHDQATAGADLLYAVDGEQLARLD